MTTTARTAITTVEEHRRALNRIRKLIDATDIPSQSDETASLAGAVQDFERRQYPIELPDPVDAIEYEIDQESCTQEELVKIIGSQTAYAEFMKRDRPLTPHAVNQISNLTGIPKVTLMRPFRESAAP